jgi:hypothetical protein
MNILKTIEKLQKIAETNPEVDVTIMDPIEGGFRGFENVDLVEDEDGESSFVTLT